MPRPAHRAPDNLLAQFSQYVLNAETTPEEIHSEGWLASLMHQRRSGIRLPKPTKGKPTDAAPLLNEEL